MQLGLDAFERTLKINVTGVFVTAKAAWAQFTKQKYGRMVLVSSPALFGSGVAAYSASKGSMVALTNSLQFEANKLRPREAYDIKV
jgi:NAD(P)-dependent dehydrogenase (short-subunit alcohol dehydrogenase family)